MAKTNTPQPRRVFTDDDVQNVKRWRDEGRSMNDIQKLLQCGWKLLADILVAAGVDRSPKPRGASFWTPEKREELRRLIVEEKVTVAEAARRLGSTLMGTGGAMARYRIYDVRVFIDRDGVSRTESRRWLLKEGDEEKLRTMAANGATMRQIAEAFGVTKSAVAGRCWRMKIKIVGREPTAGREKRFGQKPRVRTASPPKPRQRVTRPQQTRINAAQRQFEKSLKFAIPRKKEPEIMSLFDQAKMVGGTKSIVDIERGDCKYLYTVDDETRYCSDPVVYKSYCDHHAGVVYKQRAEMTTMERRLDSGFIPAPRKNTWSQGASA